MEEQEAVRKVNIMLEFINLSVKLKDILDAVPFLWISLFEGLFETKLPEIHRDFTTLNYSTKIDNCKILIETLEDLVLQIPLPHITPQKIVQGDYQTLIYLTDIFWKLYIQISNSDQFFSASPKQVAFDQETDKYDEMEELYSSAPLEILPDDTPYVKALKLKKKRIFNERYSHSSRNTDQSTSKYKNVIERHKNTVKPVKLQRTRPKSPQDDTEEDMIYNSDIQDENPSIAEKNLKKLISNIKSNVPLLKTFPRPGDEEKLWNEQLNIKKRALDDRLWTQKVVLQQHLELLKGDVPLSTFLNDERDKKLVEWRRKQQLEKKKLKLQLEDDFRRIKRATRNEKEANDRVKRAQKKMEFQEETMIAGIFDKYLKKQRSEIIQERKLEKEIRDNYKNKSAMLREAQIHYLNDQINMLQGELQDATDEERLLLKAQKQEMINMTREEKAIQKKNISSIRKKLESDYWDNTYREEMMETLGSRIAFKTAARNKDL